MLRPISQTTDFKPLIPFDFRAIGSSKVSEGSAHFEPILSGQKVRWRQNGLWQSRYALPMALEKRIPMIGNSKISSNNFFSFRREAVGATNIQSLSVHQTGEIPLNLTSPIDAIDRFDEVQRAAMMSIEDAIINVRDLDNYVDSEKDSREFRNTMRTHLRGILHDLDVVFCKGLEAYEIWWTLATENNSLSQLRREKLFGEIRKLTDAGGARPVVAKISLPFGKFNKILGETAATQVKWDVLNLFKQIYGDAPGAVTFIDSTGIALVIPGNEYDKVKLEEILVGMSQHLEAYLRYYVQTYPGNKVGIRIKDDSVAVVNDQGKWLDVHDLFSGDVYAGVAPVDVEVPASTSAIEEAIHKADMMARARSHKAKQRFGQEEATLMPFAHVDDETPEADLELGKGSLPDGHIPTEDDIFYTLYQIGQQNRRDFDRLELPARKTDYKIFASQHEGLAQIYAVCQTIHDNMPDEQITTDDYFFAITQSFMAITNRDDERYDNDHKTSSYLVSLFAQKATVMVSNMPLKSLPIHMLMNLGVERRYIRKAQNYTGREGSLTKIREVFHSINQLLTQSYWSNGDMLAIDLALATLWHVLKKLLVLVSQDMEKSLDDPRFPGKVKYRAFALKLARRYRDRPFKLEIIDFDNLSSFLNDARIQVHPLQRHDSNMSALAYLSRHAALLLGIDEQDVIYAAPGGDELASAIPANADEVAYTAKKRLMLEERYGHIRVAARRKVWVDTPEGKQLKKWPVYVRKRKKSAEITFKVNGNDKKNVAAREVIAIDLRDQDLFVDFLKNPLAHAGARIRIFRVIHGLEEGGVMVEDMPIEHLAGFVAATERVGISATHEIIAPKQEDESITQFAARVERTINLGLHLIDKVKTMYGKDSTWNLHGQLEMGLTTQYFPLLPHHLGFVGDEEYYTQIFDFEVMLRSARGFNAFFLSQYSHRQPQEWR